MGVGSLGQEDPLEEDMATHSSILPGESYGQRSLAASQSIGLRRVRYAEATEYICTHWKLLYNTVSPAWCFVMTWKGGMRRRRDA